MEHVISFYKENYKPTATIVTLTFTNKAQNSIQLNINPWALASISTLFKAIPCPPNATYEMNEDNWLETASDVECFLAMCRYSVEPLVCGQYEKCYERWDVHEVHSASKLCDFLGITAMPVFEEAYSTRKIPTLLVEKTRVISMTLYHRIAVVTNNAALLKELTEHILTATKLRPRISAPSTWDKHNRSMIAVLALYTEANSYWVSAPANLMEFMAYSLGWPAGVHDYCGIKIEIPEPAVKEIDSGIVGA